MNYDKAELRKIAIIMLEKCQDDLKENGSLMCDAVALDGNGSGYLIPLRFYTVEEKYEVQAGLKEILRAIDARAVVMMLNLRLNGLFFSDYLGRHSLFSCCLDRAGQPGSAFGD